MQKEAAATQMMAAVTRDQAELRETKDAVHAALAAREAKLAEAEAVLAEVRRRASHRQHPPPTGPFDRQHTAKVAAK